MAKVYIIKIKARRDFLNSDNGFFYRKGATYSKIANTKTVKDLKSLHKEKNYSKKQPYKIISIKEAKAKK